MSALAARIRRLHRIAPTIRLASPRYTTKNQRLPWRRNNEDDHPGDALARNNDGRFALARPLVINRRRALLRLPHLDPRANTAPSK
jgi:hypothetical protein